MDGLAPLRNLIFRVLEVSITSNRRNIKFLNMCALAQTTNMIHRQAGLPQYLLVSHGYTNLNTYDPDAGRIYQGYV